jgi:hypothetical protein
MLKFSGGLFVTQRRKGFTIDTLPNIKIITIFKH